MAFVRQASNGKFYICSGNDLKKFKNWFLIKNNATCSSGMLQISNISFPKVFIGKKIRLKIEVIE